MPPRPSQVYGLTEYHAKNAIALERLKTEFKGKVEVLPLPVPVLRDLRKLAAEVVREESEKTPMARKVHASFTKFQALVGPLGPRRGRRLPPVRRGVRTDGRDDRTTPVHREGGRGAGGRCAAAIVDAPNVIAQPKVQWRMSTAWPPALDMLQGAAQRLAKVVEEMSGGRFRIEVFAGGQIMRRSTASTPPPRARSRHSWARRTTGRTKEPAIEWFGTIPFGMNPEGMAAWYYQGDGLKLWEETYAAFNLVPRPGPAFAPQMGGWFRKKINTIGDFKGLKMRIPGLGGKVVARAGATTVLTPAAEIYAALERGVIDAAEWVAPHDDMKLGLHKTARYYYYPGWHEPGTVNEFGFNKKAYEALPVDLRRTLDHAAAAVAGLWPHGLPREERDRAGATQDGVQGQGRDPPVPGPGAARSQEAGGRGRQGGIREDPHGPEGARVLHEVPGAGGPAGTTSRKAPTISSWRV